MFYGGLEIGRIEGKEVTVFHLFVQGFGHAVGEENVLLSNEPAEGITDLLGGQGSVFRPAVGDNLEWEGRLERAVFYESRFDHFGTNIGGESQTGAPSENEAGKIVYDEIDVDLDVVAGSEDRHIGVPDFDWLGGAKARVVVIATMWRHGAAVSKQMSVFSEGDETACDGFGSEGVEVDGNERPVFGGAGGKCLTDVFDFKGRKLLGMPFAATELRR